jgi:hypothetical protein
VGEDVVDDTDIIPPGPEARDEAASAIRAEAVLPPAPTAAGLALVGGLLAIILAVAATAYILGAPTMAVSPGIVALTGHSRDATGWVGQCWTGGVALSQVVFRATYDLPLQMMALLVTLVFMGNLFVDHGGAFALRYCCVTAWRCVAAAPRRIIRAPRVVHNVGVGVAIYMLLFMLAVLMGRADGMPTAARVAQARQVFEAAPLSLAARFDVNASLMHRHNVTFLDVMSSHDTSHLLYDLDQGGRQGLVIYDTGAAVHAGNGTLEIVQGTIMTNTMAVSTANGLTVPPTSCTQRMRTRDRMGRATTHLLTKSLMLEDCNHTLVSGGRMASQGTALYLAPEDEMSYLLPSRTDRSRDVPLINVGVLIVPDITYPVGAYSTVIHGSAPNDAMRSGEFLHDTFNHSTMRRLRKIPDVAIGLDEWRDATMDQCTDHACLQANAKRVGSTSKVPKFKAPGDCIGMDIWTNQTPHVHGGQRGVIGFYDMKSKLDRSYLIRAKSDAPTAIGQCLAWCNSLGVNVSRCHTDNAPDLCKGESAEVFRKRGVHVTTSSPYVPRQNGAMERRWELRAETARAALQRANLPDSFWWYAWRDAEQKSWCIPHRSPGPDGRFSCPWSDFTGSRPNALVQRPFGVLGFVKSYHPISKTAAHGRRCVCLGRDGSGWLMLEIATGKKIVTPHVHFVLGCYPGLSKKPAANEPATPPHFGTTRPVPTVSPSQGAPPQDAPAPAARSRASRR